MSNITNTNGTAAAAKAAPLTSDQQQALKRLHAAAQQFESVFVDMLFKEMRKSAPPVSLTGQTSNADAMFTDMLDEKRSEDMAKTGSFGIAKMLESQLKASVLANPQAALKTRRLGEGEF
ncbi:MAG: rod-binding protein [Candidatus Velthaea sp.]|jgi:flagellar protein FlgJ